MRKYNCIIVDDEPVAQRILEGYLADLPEFNLVGKCLHALAARELLQTESVDLMLLDLEMPKLKGFSFLKTLSDPPAVIITTAHREFALESYELEVLDYLLKPISFERFLKAINRFKKSTQPDPAPSLSAIENDAFLYVKSDRKTLKIALTDILYVEGMNNYVKLHCKGQIHIVYASLSNMCKKLGEGFLRIHKSYVINKEKVTAFSKEEIELGEVRIPVGNSFRSGLAELAPTS